MRSGTRSDQEPTATSASVGKDLCPDPSGASSHWRGGERLEPQGMLGRREQRGAGLHGGVNPPEFWESGERARTGGSPLGRTRGSV